jgi:hypothetical protein
MTRSACRARTTITMLSCQLSSAYWRHGAEDGFEGPPGVTESTRVGGGRWVATAELTAVHAADEQIPDHPELTIETPAGAPDATRVPVAVSSGQA